jgi:DNA-binding NarL/FixJ family response regulator
MRLVIGEDSALFREGLARLLEDAGHVVVGRAADAPSTIAAVDEHRPDLAILDIRMPPDGVDDGAALPGCSATATRTWASCCCPNTSRPATRWTWLPEDGSATY